MHVLSTPLLLLTLAGAAPREERIEGGPSERQVREAIAASTRFLEKEGMAWMKSQQCASCHHIPLMVWALNEARNRGYRVNEESLTEVTSWALDGRNHGQVFPDLPLDKKRTETDYLGPLFMALGVGATENRDPAVETARGRLLDHALSQQAKDGSWHANSGGRPPVHASKDVQTSWLLVALSDPAAANATDDRWDAYRKAAAEWLATNPPADSHQAVAMRVLVYRQLGKASADAKPLIESLLQRQNEDGGWSQTATMKSDAFATGLALYALSGQDATEVNAAVRRACAFLIETQQPDGSWPMTSRRAEPKGPGPAHDLRPIAYVGTAWATIGLVRSFPAPAASE